MLVASAMAADHHADIPPPYSPSDDFESLADEKTKSPLVFPPGADEPGYAVTSALTRGLQVPSRSAACTSGFDYPDELAQFRISPDQWTKFTQVISDEAKLSRQQWTTVIGKGLGILAVGGLMVGFLGAIPALIASRLARRRQEQRNLTAALTGTESQRLSRHISHWNDTFFRPRGVLIRVDLPNELLGDLDTMDLSSNRAASRSRDKAALKARIVVIPLEQIPSSMPTSSRNSQERS